jgi:hypothetical protein
MMKKKQVIKKRGGGMTKKKQVMKKRGGGMMKKRGGGMMMKTMKKGGPVNQHKRMAMGEKVN